MENSNFYNVMDLTFGDPREDLGLVINRIIADVKARQAQSFDDGRGKCGAVIYLPAGDYALKTQAVIDVSYLKIKGDGHGFTSSSIRFNTDPKECEKWHEIWPGGSRVMVKIQGSKDNAEQGAAFLIKREGNPRISSVEFENFMIDGLHFLPDGSDCDPENSYENGLTGIYAASQHDSFVIRNMGFIYLEHAVVCCHADALTITSNFIAECGSCVELKGSGQASKITDNLMGAGYKGFSIFAENFTGLLIASNNIFPRGASTVYLKDTVRSSVTANRFHTFYAGAIELKGRCAENLIAANHLYRAHEPWAPLQNRDNGLDDDYGLIIIDGIRNTVTANHLSLVVDKRHLKLPRGALAVMIKLRSGGHNYLCANHLCALTEAAGDLSSLEAQECFEAQVQAALAAFAGERLEVIKVLCTKDSRSNYVLDCACEDEMQVDPRENAVRALPKASALSA